MFAQRVTGLDINLWENPFYVLYNYEPTWPVQLERHLKVTALLASLLTIDQF